MTGNHKHTADEKVIIEGVERHLAHMRDYTFWTIGLTSDPHRQMRERNHPAFWHCWHAETPQTARKILEHFVQKGMKVGPSDEEDSTYVYIF